MYNHATSDYKCPICIVIHGEESSDTLISQSDILFQDDLVMVFINSFFRGNNPGSVIVVPKEHIENIYDLTLVFATRIQEVAKKMSLVIKKAYNADGITIIQNNEPAGDQHVYHYHLHVFPRYENDNLSQNLLNKQNTTREQRKVYIDKIKIALNSDSND